jgi:hypothetical protein
MIFGNYKDDVFSTGAYGRPQAASGNLSLSSDASSDKIHYNEYSDSLGWGACYGEMSFNATPIHSGPKLEFFQDSMDLEESQSLSQLLYDNSSDSTL